MAVTLLNVTSKNDRQAQALLIAITHNLLLCYEQHLKKSRDIKNTAEDERRAKRV